MRRVLVSQQDALASGAYIDVSRVQPAAPAASAAVMGDDLTRIEGIGPKISATLRNAGIASFAQLAATEVSRLKEILKTGGIRIAFPETWPEQAALAASGRWEALESLQQTLTAGRRA